MLQNSPSRNRDCEANQSAVCAVGSLSEDRKRKLPPQVVESTNSPHMEFSSQILVGEGSKRRRTMDDVENRRQQFFRKNDWRPIDDQMFPTPAKDGPDAENDALISGNLTPMCVKFKRPGVLQEINAKEEPRPSHFQFRNFFVRLNEGRGCPLPVLSWADSQDLWKAMVYKENAYPRSGRYLSKHPDLQPRMRSILVDWLMEVCEVYTLKRESFYLAVDYIDRYLATISYCHKTRLQLVGVTALFLAAKLEEVYPPKLADFAYVTDGACSEEEILSQELLLLTALRWSLLPVTAVNWLNLYLQIAHTSCTSSHSSGSFFLPQYPPQTFAHISQLLDLCTLDLESVDFRSSVLAAAALYHFSSQELATQVSGFEFKDIAECVHWMAPFAVTVRDTGLQPLKQFKRVHEKEHYCVQTHATSMDIFDTAMENRSLVHTQLNCQSPTEVGGFMTPPKSSQKPSITSPQPSGVCSS